MFVEDSFGIWIENVMFSVCSLDYEPSGSLRMVVSRSFGWLIANIYGEFDPGSGRTLAACLTHASRTVKPSLLGGSVANG